MTDLSDPDSEPVAPQPATDPVAHAEARKSARMKEDRRVTFMRRMLADPAGREVLWEWLGDCGAFSINFSASPAGMPDPFATAFQYGKRDWGLRLYQTMLRVDHGAVALMHAELDTSWPKDKRRKAVNA